jgi:hypothetical protein
MLSCIEGTNVHRRCNLSVIKFMSWTPHQPCIQSSVGGNHLRLAQRWNCWVKKSDSLCRSPPQISPVLRDVLLRMAMKMLGKLSIVTRNYLYSEIKIISPGSLKVHLEWSHPVDWLSSLEVKSFEIQHQVSTGNGHKNESNLLKLSITTYWIDPLATYMCQ